MLKIFFICICFKIGLEEKPHFIDESIKTSLVLGLGFTLERNSLIQSTLYTVFAPK